MEMSEKQMDAFMGFLVETFEFSDEQQMALDRQIPMTQEMFDSIMARCEELGTIADNTFVKMLVNHPEFICSEGTAVRTPEEQEKNWEELCDKIRAKYGQDALND